MKNKSILLEVNRIKNLMGVQVLSEIRLPEDFLTKFIRFRPILRKIDIEKYFPDFPIDRLNVNTFAKYLEDTVLEKSQIKYLLTLGDDSLKDIIYKTLLDDSSIKRSIELLNNAKKDGKMSTVDDLTNRLKNMLPDEMVDDFIQDVTNNLNQRSKGVVASTRALVSQAKELFNNIADANDVAISKDAGLKVYLKKSAEILENLTPEQLKYLDNVTLTEIDAMLATIKQKKPGVYTYLKRTFNFMSRNKWLTLVLIAICTYLGIYAYKGQEPISSFFNRNIKNTSKDEDSDGETKTDSEEGQVDWNRYKIK